ncbi:hypothetical protein BCR36DRAFT_580678 [Piromyces finnis]|uniref:CoA-dependent acyltransferase n=1 Tax=Piromyces finnis TaxID=1754191 RepID=A0A1Y1VJQ7_9FUNG|nr:hypothetical protein BCR36DRAFT_580678 [Piromyces finnis]|eukprot:ORX57261.1 hypothetical protein BCR36DRAFT_580678 [Piromyces finnis]
MWEEFIKKDCRIIRPLDGYECCLTGSYINVTDIFPRFSIDEFKKNAQENLSKIEIFNFAIKFMDGHSFWIKKPFKIQIEEVEWSENEEIENFLKNEDKITTPHQNVRYEDEKDVINCYLFKLCHLKKNKTKLTFSALHAVSDGRTIFTMYDILRKIINGEQIEKMNTPLCSFNQMSNFHDLNPSLYNQPPKTWNDIINLSILPKISEPIKYVTIHNIYDYPPISKFCKQNNVTVQAMLIAVASRAARKFNNLPKETPIWNYTPCDARVSPYATETFKNQKFFCNAGALFPCVIGQNTVLDDIKHCMKKLQESIPKLDNIAQILRSALSVDPITLKFTPPEKMPDFHKQAVVASSNIGRVNGNNPLFHLSMDCTNEFYSFATHCYHTENKIYMATIMPINFNKEYISTLNKEMDLIFNILSE